MSGVISRLVVVYKGSVRFTSLRGLVVWWLKLWAPIREIHIQFHKLHANGLSKIFKCEGSISPSSYSSILVYLLTSLLHIVTFDGTSTEVLQDGRDFFYKNGPLQLLEI